MASPGSSSREDELLRSSGGEAEGVQECAPMDLAAREAQRKEKKKESRNKARTRRRMEERQARREPHGPLQSAPVAPEACPPVPGPVESRPGASTAVVGVPGRGDRGPTVPRGPLARRMRREDKREVKRRSFVLPTAPAAVGEGEPGGPKGQPGTSSRTVRKRARADKATPPERQKKKVRRAVPPASAGGPSHVSPLLRRGEGAVPRRGAEDGPLTKRVNQVAILSNREDGVVTSAEGGRLRENLVSEMFRTMVGPEGGPRGPELRFRNSGLVDPGWFLVTAQDEVSMRWLLEDWTPLSEEGVVFRAIRASDAPWPEKIGFWLRSPEVDLPRVRAMLDLQNRSLEVNRWRHLETTGGPGGWHLTFMVGQEISRRLEEAGWVLYFELVTLAVRRVPAWSGVVRQASRVPGEPRPAEGGK